MGQHRLRILLPVTVGLLAVVITAFLPVTASSAAGDFYAPPSPLTAAPPGTLIRIQPLALGGPGLAAPPHKAWSVMYHSRNAQGRDIAVTGAVLTPTAAWTGKGPRPFISFAVGTQGLGPQCAPSKQLAAGTEYEVGNLLAALSLGYGVAVTDYEGYVTGSTPTYTTGASEAHTVLDAMRAARRIAGSGATAATPVGLWGYSQGGGATAWAAALAPSYAPDIRLVGAAAGGVPADLAAVGANLNGGVGGGLLGESLVGFTAAYPKQAQFDQLVNAQGRQDAAQIKKDCVADDLTRFAGLDVKNLTKAHLSYAQFIALPGEAKILEQNDVGSAAPAPKVPVLQYQSLTDELVPFPQAFALHQKWCTEGVKTQFVA